MRDKIKLGIVGSRSRNSSYDESIIYIHIKYLVDKYKDVDIVIISGGCTKGADRFAENIAKEMGLKIEIHLPSDDGNKSYGVRCFERNILIAESCDILIAMWDNKSKGTKHTIDLCKKLNKKIILV